MKGLIVINAYPNGAKFYRQAERIAEELRALGCETDVKRNGEVYALLDDKGEIKLSFGEKYDFAIYLDKDKYLGRALEGSGLKLYNSAQAIETCDDKMQTYFALRNAGVALAKTIPAPLCYTPNAKADKKFLENVAKELGFPMVVKKSYGSFGAGVQLVHGMPELIEIANKFLYEPHFYQAYIEQSSGKDIRVIVIGGKVVSAMERVAQKGEFRSNVELGGVGKRINLSEKYAQTAIKAAQALELDYCGVDILESGNGVVCEVNSNAFFEGIESVTGVNVAKAYAEYILSNG
jgi:ribosomal protein S6--L-glutamate ligase/gamma-F420-2:alpha-L-glutamate ligase